MDIAAHMGWVSGAYQKSDGSIVFLYFVENLNREDPAMNENHNLILKQSKKVCDESQSVRDNAKIVTAESAEAVEPKREAMIKSRLRRRKRTVIIK
jgi:hypothetical protein